MTTADKIIKAIIHYAAFISCVVLMLGAVFTTKNTQEAALWFIAAMLVKEFDLK